MWFNMFPHKLSRPVLVEAFYRPPSTNVETDLKIENNAETAYLRNQATIVMGDFNINSIDKTSFEKHQVPKEFKYDPNGLRIYTTHPDRITDIIIPNIGLADHLPVFSCGKL